MPSPFYKIEQVHSGDEIGLPPNGEISGTYTLGHKSGLRTFRVVTGEKNPFWATVFFWTTGDGVMRGKPVIIHQGGTEESFPAHFASGVPSDWGVHASPSG
jgi:hypothetical protein